MPRTNKYDQSLDPNRPGEPIKGWDAIIVDDRASNASWDATYSNPDVVPAQIQSHRDRLMNVPTRKGPTSKPQT